MKVGKRIFLSVLYTNIPVRDVTVKRIKQLYNTFTFLNTKRHRSPDNELPFKIYK